MQPTAPKRCKLSDSDKELIEKAQLQTYYNLIDQDLEEDIAVDALANYDPSTRRTVVRGIPLHLTKENLQATLGLCGQTKGGDWTSAEVAQYLQESKRDTEKRRNDTQGIHLRKVKDKGYLEFISAAIAFRQIPTHLNEVLFMDVMRVQKHGQFDFAGALFRYVEMQMQKLAVNKQKVYRCGHVWQALYFKALGEARQSEASPGNVAVKRTGETEYSHKEAKRPKTAELMEEEEQPVASQDGLGIPS
ncbi:hypothetical protein GOP47_0001136 [Adiantum capillus-veneris]|uniref:Uncharacterized protein n=1 Tax=Adiantum capillus-veneris TaxID=13818 RepID=A0A9D4ZTM3_ADICA|nr:hypothetical protein GOP47_0001136 [Adiantum capillus-veneris]